MIKNNLHKGLKKSIQRNIMATALCPLLAMSTSVAVLALRDSNPMIIANVIAAILAVGVIQLLCVSHSIVKSVRMAENYLNQLADGNLDIHIDEKLTRRDDELGSMSKSLISLKKRLKDSMGNIKEISGKLAGSQDNLELVVDDVQKVADNINNASGQMVTNAERQNEYMADASDNIAQMNSLIADIAMSVKRKCYFKYMTRK